jgi:FkbM family methyltransferase
VRTLLFPLRWAVATLPRRSFLRSACVPLLKIASHRRGLLASLPDIRPIDRPDISFDTSDSWVLDDVFWFGVQGYEGILAELWTDFARRATSILEIGGNVGLYSVIGGKATRGVYTVVEPIPEIAAILRSNLLRNGLSRVEVIEGAVIPSGPQHRVTLSVPKERAAVPTGAHLLADVEIASRESERQVVVPGWPVVPLVTGRDLIKIDAEGIEHALLTAAMPVLVKTRPTIIVEILPESTRLATIISRLAREAGYLINVVPEFGSEKITVVGPEDFTATLPQRYHSKDVVLTVEPIA